jgi:hypothetical protein
MFSAITTYSAYSYFQVYTAVRGFSVTIESFQLNMVDSIIATEIKIQNPSDVAFELLLIEERIEANFEYILNTGLYRTQDPLPLPPSHNLSVIVTSIVPSTRTSTVMSRLEDYWQLSIRVRLSGPVVEEFWLDRYFITEIEAF